MHRLYLLHRRRWQKGNGKRRPRFDLLRRRALAKGQREAPPSALAASPAPQAKGRRGAPPLARLSGGSPRRWSNPPRLDRLADLPHCLLTEEVVEVVKHGQNAIMSFKIIFSVQGPF